MTTSTAPELRELLGQLLMHADLGTALVEGDYGSHGVALILDGWYTHKEDAARVRPVWESILADVRKELGR